MLTLSKDDFSLLLSKYRKMYRSVKVADGYAADENADYSGAVRLIEAEGIRYLVELDDPFFPPVYPERTESSTQGLDHVTGLYDLQSFSMLASALLSSESCGDYDIIVADMCDFKMINTVYGINTGDKVLNYVSKVLKRYFSDGIGARCGDKFFFLSPAVEDSMHEKARLIRDEIRHCSFAANLNAQFGEYKRVDKALSVSTVCDRALMAVSVIKNTPSECYSLYSEEINNRKLREHGFESCFDDAIRSGQFQVYLQPKVNAVTESIVEAEALVRWLDGNGNLIQPGDFIPLFERDGLISRLDEYMFKKVCLYQKERIDSGKHVVPISVNLSRNSLYRKGTSAVYKTFIEATGIPFDLVPLELTESAAFGDSRIDDIITEFVRSGFTMQMDDFGSGYSSLANLSTLPFSVLKIDKSLNDRIGTPKGDIIVKYTVQIAHDMGLHVVAEGVETADQLRFLKDIGCDTVQGYFFSPPRDIKAFEKMLENGIRNN